MQRYGLRKLNEIRAALLPYVRPWRKRRSKCSVGMTPRTRNSAMPSDSSPFQLVARGNAEFRSCRARKKPSTSSQCRLAMSLHVPGASHIFRSGGGATSPPIEEVGPTHVFGATFDGGRSAAPLSTSGASPRYPKKTGWTRTCLCQDGSNMFQLPRSNACAAARASSVIDPPASIRPISSTRSDLSNLDMLIR